MTNTPRISNINVSDARRERRLRREADRLGLRLDKSRNRRIDDITSGTYQLVDSRFNFLVCGDTHAGFEFNLDEIEQELVARSAVSEPGPHSAE